MKNVMVLIIIFGFLFVGLNIMQAQELTWVKENFNIDAGTWAEWWGGYTSVVRVVDYPETNDKTLACTFNKTGAADIIATGIYSAVGQNAESNEDVADTLTMEVYFPLDFPIGSVSRFSFVCQPQGGSWPWYEVDFTPVLGEWNHLVLNIDSLKVVNVAYANQSLKVGPRIYTSTAAAGVYYVDNIVLHGVRKPIGVFQSPKITVTHQIYWGVKGQRRWADRIRWYDLSTNIAETYNLYASKTADITNVNAPDVVKLAAGMTRGNLVYNHWVYSTDTSPQTWYYAMTVSATDTLGLPIESALADTGKGSGNGPTTVPYIIPLVSDWSGTFYPECNLQEFYALAATYTDMVIQPEWMFGPATGPYATDAEVPVNMDQFDFEMYMVMDPEFLYIAGWCKDDNIAAVKQLWQGESADIFMSFYNADTVKSWPANMTAANGDHRFGILWGAEGAARFPTGGGADGTIKGVPQMETFIDSLAGPDGTAVWEMAIPLDSIPTAGTFVPTDGMNLPFCLWQNTVDNDARGQVLIVGCADNNASGAGQENKLLAVNPNRWSRPNTWGQIRISTVDLVGVNESGLTPDKFELAQNYPNPFNPTTKINFSLAKASNVKLTVYNILGQKVATLVDGYMNQGPQSVTFNASKLTSGVYFYRLEAGSFTANKKMLLVK
jgi:hypothetical protein